MHRAREMERQLYNFNTFKRENKRVMPRIEDRAVKGYADSSSKLTIIWAKYSYNFDTDVIFERKEQVIKLAQSYLLEHLSDTLGLIENNDLPVDIDSDAIERKADKLKDAVMEDWKGVRKVIVIPKNMGTTTM